jgi:methylated-DNA-protein-cysteine methyltransferase-like protein
VVNAQGKLTGRFAFGGINVQKERLEADGIEVSDDYRVDLKKYQWKPDL